MLSFLLDTLSCVEMALSSICYLREEEGRTKRVLVLTGIGLLVLLLTAICIYAFAE